MSGPSHELDQFGLCRISKHQHMLERFPFTRPHWSRWIGIAPRWTERDRLRLYHALAPYRELGEVDGAGAVILAASRQRRGRSPDALERLLVGLRYLEPAERAEVYRDPAAWLARLRRLSARTALQSLTATARVRIARPALRTAPEPAAATEPTPPRGVDAAELAPESRLRAA